MLKDIIEVKPTREYRLWLRFEDGVQGEVDLRPILSFKGVFAPLMDPRFFEQVRVNPELGTICWPNDADVDPVVLYALVTNEPIPNYLAETDPVSR